MVKRKSLAAFLLLMITVPVYSLISEGPLSTYVRFFVYALSFAVLCGTLLSIGLEALIKKLGSNSFPLRLILHIGTALLLTAAFVTNNYITIAMYFALPVALGYFVIDEGLRVRSKRLG
ncbi:hypothetical protein [Halobacillus sp. KGW1]|uniref:hypothetical protein n=1 Tax=Halobacillus sp. KGW1 TaxID=1793726 RepID=UPI000780ABA1|nr:hypothetical protein [Halobacillus sp. KGW1]